MSHQESANECQLKSDFQLGKYLSSQFPWYHSRATMSVLETRTRGLHSCRTTADPRDPTWQSSVQDNFLIYRAAREGIFFLPAVTNATKWGLKHCVWGVVKNSLCYQTEERQNLSGEWLKICIYLYLRTSVGKIGIKRLSCGQEQDKMSHFWGSGTESYVSVEEWDQKIIHPAQTSTWTSTWNDTSTCFSFFTCFQALHNRTTLWSDDRIPHTLTLDGMHVYFWECYLGATRCWFECPSPDYISFLKIWVQWSGTQRHTWFVL